MAKGSDSSWREEGGVRGLGGVRERALCSRDSIKLEDLKEVMAVLEDGDRSGEEKHGIRIKLTDHEITRR